MTSILFGNFKISLLVSARSERVIMIFESKHNYSSMLDLFMFQDVDIKFVAIRPGVKTVNLMRSPRFSEVNN